MVNPHIRKDERTDRFIVDHEDEAAKRHQPGFNLKRDALEKLAEVAGKKSAPPSVCGHTVASRVSAFLLNLKANGKSPATLTSYTHILNVYLLPEVGGLDLLQLDLKVIRALREHLYGKLAVKYASSAYSVFCGLLDDAVTWKLIGSHCARDYHRRIAGEPQQRNIVLPRLAELETLLTGPLCLAKVAVALGVLAGLRVGEIRALTRRDVDLAEGYINIKHTASLKTTVKKPKSDAGARQVPIADELAEILKLWFAQGRFADSDYIMADKDRRVVPKPWLIPNRVRAYQRLLGIPSRRSSGGYLGYNMHLFRHACVALWIEGGADADWVRQKIGHQYLQTTLDVYGGLFDEAHEKEDEFELAA